MEPSNTDLASALALRTDPYSASNSERISTSIDLDDYFVLDRNPAQIAEFYADILFRHLAIDLPEGYLAAKYSIDTAAQLVSKLFTDRQTLHELARAAEGVVRDFINIFSNAFFQAHRRGRTNIDKKRVVEAARQWFEQDKVHHLDERLHQVLQGIVEEVIGHRQARSFMLPRALERDPTIQSLFDAGVLHHMQRGYADKDNPGVRYNIYTLDYGTYVDLQGTSKAPDVELLESEHESPDVVVPFDDRRSIRRIVLDAAFLAKFSA